MSRTLRSRDRQPDAGVAEPSLSRAKSSAAAAAAASGRPANEAAEGTRLRIAVDIGSTIVKVARIDDRDRVVAQELVGRDFEAGIARQVEALLAAAGIESGRDQILVCSSANGGLRVGIVCLSRQFSGAVLRNQVLLAGANPVFLHDLEDTGGSLERVDMLIVGGGIDCDDAGPLETRLRAWTPRRYRYGSLVYAGNAHLAPLFATLFPGAAIVANPLGQSLAGRALTVFEAVRRAYLDDLVYKEGVSELKGGLAAGIRPTPEVVSQGLQRVLANSSTLKVAGACAVLDIGGATTDLHYTVEVVRDDSAEAPIAGPSVARFVFTDLGIVASRDTLLLQLRNHPRLFEFLQCVAGGSAREIYASMRETEYVPQPSILAYGCLFLAFDRFAAGRGPGLPSADLNRIAHVALTGGASRLMEEAKVAGVFALLQPQGAASPAVLVDRDYQMWVDGITWSGRAIAGS